MVWVYTGLIFLSLLNLVLNVYIFRAIVVTNVKIEEEVVYKKQVLDKLDVVNEIAEVRKQQSIIIETLKKIVELL